VALVVKELSKQFQVEGAVGCGFPAVVRNNIILTAANVHESWIGVNLSSLMEEATGHTVYSVNDADAAGLAEMNFGAGKGVEKGVILIITLGTGIGTAVFSNGHLVPNTEFGHLKIRGKDAETRASDAARQEKKLSWKKYSTRLEEYINEMERLFWPDLIIIGGGISKMADKFLPQLQVKTKIIPAQLLNQAGIIGAAIYASRKGVI
jgi:polyphosphate glucokinase